MPREDIEVQTMSEQELSWQELCQLMTNPDPQVRDGWALEALADGILSGRWDADLEGIRDTALANLKHPQIQARTFAPLILCWVIEAGMRDRVIFEGVRDWYRSESDLRGYDPKLGWLHAISHGADCLSLCGKYQIATAEEVLAELADRVVSCCTAWVQQEDARIVHALLQVLEANPDANLDDWFTPLNEAVKRQEKAMDQPDYNFGIDGPWLTNLRAVLMLSTVCAEGGAIAGGQFIMPACASELKERSLALIGKTLSWFIPTNR